MLFQREQLTPQGRLQALESLFSQLARREKEPLAHGHVPVDILEAYGDFNAHVRFCLESDSTGKAAPARQKLLRSIERELDALPASIMETLPTGPEANWLDFYRRLIRLHKLLEDAQPDMDGDEYRSLIQKMVQLAGRVGDAGAVEVNAASMFTLLLIQVHLRHQDAAKQRKPRKKKRKRAAKKPTAKKSPRPSARSGTDS